VRTDPWPATMAIPRPPEAPRSPANRRGVSQEGAGKDLVSCASPHTGPETPDAQVATHNGAPQTRHKINR
jgi:hypothetical protein